MRNGVEKGPDIKIEHPVLLPAPLAAYGQGVVGASPRTVAVAVAVEDRLQLLLQQHRRRGLRHPVRRIRHAEQTHAFPMIFRYLHAPHRPREVAPRGHPVPQLVEVVPQLLLEQADADRVHARRTLVGPDLLPRLRDEALVDLKRLHLRPGSAPAAPPLTGWPRADPGLHGPFAPAPLQGLPHYYEPFRPCAPHRYSAAHGVRRLRSSLSRPGKPPLAVVIGATGSPVPCQRLRRAHATSTPGTARAARRPPPG